MMGRRALLALMTVCMLSGLGAWSDRAIAYRRQVVKPGVEAYLYWPGRKISYTVNIVDAPEYLHANNGADLIGAVKRAFFTWAGPSCTDLWFEFAGTTTNNKTNLTLTGNQQPDFNNLIVFRKDWTTMGGLGLDPSALALTTLRFIPETGVIHDADIDVNAETQFWTTTDSDIRYDVQSVLTHEIGRLLGLDNSSEVDAVMTSLPLEETKTRRILHLDDVEGVCTVYPFGKLTPTGRDQPPASLVWRLPPAAALVARCRKTALVGRSAVFFCCCFSCAASACNDTRSFCTRAPLASLQLYRPLFNRIIRHLDAEAAHRMGIKALHYAEKVPGGLGALDQLASCEDPRLAVPLFGKQLKNPLGVAAGLDKDAEAFSALFALGFGHVEVGTVTPKPQPGNPKPRVWRLPAQRAVINALGFPSEGADVVLCRVGGDARRREREREHQILGINVGKNKDTPLTDARSDYCQLIERFFDAASYFVVNISSPNTPGLRELQFGDYLKDLLTAVVQTNRATGEKRGQSGRPLLVKLAPDVDDEALEQIAETAVAAGVDGLVATNTTISRQAVPTAFKQHPGGLSGLPLLRRSQQVIRRLYRAVGKRVPIIGVGGVATAEHVVEHMRAGASLVQLYTGLIYGGPFLASQILRDLTQLADRKGWCSITELVGQDE